MAEKWSVILAFIVHFVFRLPVFLSFPTVSSTVGVVPSLMILASVCLALHDTSLLPQKFKGLSGMKSVEIGLEAIFSLFFIEVAMALIWSPIENYSTVIFKRIFMDIHGPRLAEYLTTFILSTAASQVLSFTLIATGNMLIVKCSLEKAMITLMTMCCRQNNEVPSTSAVNRCAPLANAHQGAGDQTHRPRSRQRHNC